jgi:hypothetical protein
MKSLLLLLLCLFSSFSFADDLDNYIATCKDLGFRQGTEKLGDCVLELKRRDGGYVAPNAKRQNQPKSPKQNSNNQQYEAQANEYFRQQQDLYDMQMAKYQREEAEYLRQRSEYDAQIAKQEAAAEKRKNLKLIEFGLRALSGTSPNAVTNFSNASADTMGIPRLPEPQRPTMQLQENYRITTPNGNLVNCRYDPNIRQATCY